MRACILVLVVSALPAPALADTSTTSTSSTVAPGEPVTSSVPSTETSTQTTPPSTPDPAAAGDGALPPANPAPPLPDQGPVPPAPPPPPAVVAAADAAGRPPAEMALTTGALALQAAETVESRALERATASLRNVEEARARLELNGSGERALAEQLAAARGRVRDLAVAGYVNGRTGPMVHYLLHARDAEDLVNRWRLVGSAADVHRSAMARFDAARRAASADLQDEVQAVETAEASHARLLGELDAARQQVQFWTAETENRRLLLDHAGVLSPVGPSDIPRLFYDAYRRAAAAMERRAPGCRLSATAIAAVGKIESDHGRYRSGLLALNGDVLPRLVGIPLDGTRGTAVIRDTDGGLLDGDPVYDRAVGPMQFIPSTWKPLAQDANGDGRADPNNAYDAALGTAAYLCRAGAGGALDTEAGLRPAIFAYNRSTAYVDKVLSWMRTYDAVASQLPAFV